MNWKHWSKLWELAKAANLDPEITAYCLKQRDELYKAETAKAQAKMDNFQCTDDDLVYAASARCACGAGVAYHKGIGTFGHWDCSDILTGRKKIESEVDVKLHLQYPFVYYDIKSEDQPSANGATTRPAKVEEVEAAAEGR